LSLQSDDYELHCKPDCVDSSAIAASGYTSTFYSPTSFPATSSSMAGAAAAATGAYPGIYCSDLGLYSYPVVGYQQRRHYNEGQSGGNVVGRYIYDGHKSNSATVLHPVEADLPRSACSYGDTASTGARGVYDRQSSPTVFETSKRMAPSCRVAQASSGVRLPLYCNTSGMEDDVMIGGDDLTAADYHGRSDITPTYDCGVGARRLNIYHAGFGALSNNVMTTGSAGSAGIESPSPQSSATRSSSASSSSSANDSGACRRKTADSLTIARSRPEVIGRNWASSSSTVAAATAAAEQRRTSTVIPAAQSKLSTDDSGDTALLAAGTALLQRRSVITDNSGCNGQLMSVIRRNNNHSVDNGQLQITSSGGHPQPHEFPASAATGTVRSKTTAADSTTRCSAIDVGTSTSTADSTCSTSNSCRSSSGRQTSTVAGGSVSLATAYDCRVPSGNQLPTVASATAEQDTGGSTVCYPVSAGRQLLQGVFASTKDDYSSGKNAQRLPYNHSGLYSFYYAAAAASGGSSAGAASYDVDSIAASMTPSYCAKSGVGGNYATGSGLGRQFYIAGGQQASSSGHLHRLQQYGGIGGGDGIMAATGGSHSAGLAAIGHAGYTSVIVDTQQLHAAAATANGYVH
jgi:hypothetical protein